MLAVSGGGGGEMGTVITIARELGSYGSMVATELARRLSYRLLRPGDTTQSRRDRRVPDEQMLARLEMHSRISQVMFERLQATKLQLLDALRPLAP